MGYIRLGTICIKANQLTAFDTQCRDDVAKRIGDLTVDAVRRQIE